MEEPLPPRQFLRQHALPQLVRIDDAHLHQINFFSKNWDSNNHSQTHHQHRRQRHSLRNLQSPPSLDCSHSSSSGSVDNCSSNLSSLKNFALIDDSSKRMNSKEGLDLDQPFLLYKAYSYRQVTASVLNIESNSDQNSFKRSGPALLIPDTYSGKCRLSYFFFFHLNITFSKKVPRNFNDKVVQAIKII